MIAAYLFLGLVLTPGLVLALQLDLARAEQRRTYAPRHRKSSCEVARRRHPKQEIVR